MTNRLTKMSFSENPYSVARETRLLLSDNFLLFTDVCRRSFA